MGIDFQFIAYQGRALDEDDLARVLQQHVPSVTLYRHATFPLQGSDLHLVAMYEHSEDPTDTREVAAPRRETSPDRPLSEIVKEAWKQVYAEIKKEELAAVAQSKESADDENCGVSLARELSRLVGRTYWVVQGDHACVGGYALFDNGKLIDPDSEDDLFAEGDDYIDLPERKWLAATGVSIGPNDAFVEAFPDTDEPPLRLASDPSTKIPFDGRRFEVSLE